MRPSSKDRSLIAFDGRYINDRYHGIGRYAYQLLEALSRIDDNINYVVYYNPTYKNTRFDLDALNERRNVRLVPLRLSIHKPAEQFVLPLLLARAGAVLFHSPYVSLPLFAPMKQIITVHDLILERFPAYAPDPLLRLGYRALTWFSTLRAAAIVVVSEDTRADLIRYYPGAAGKAYVVSPGVGPTFQKVVDLERLAEVRLRYRLPQRFALALGAGRPHKNLGMLVDAFSALDSRATGALVIAGEPDDRYEDEVASRISAQRLDDRVLRIGAVREVDLPSLYTLADVFVFPSIVEGFGLPVLEAMACGVPVLASNTASIPEASGDAALAFDPLDRPGLTVLLERVLSDESLRTDLRERGLARAREFSWERTASDSLKVYEAVLGFSKE